jgi:alkane 1-monooxygenase
LYPCLGTAGAIFADSQWRRHFRDADNFFSNCFLVRLRRHADHHTHPARPYQALLHHDDSRKLPTGYDGMMPLALIPPLWFAMMNARVPALPGGGAAQGETRPA